ncbi:MAG TPA: zf-HC2 domain-containing protein [Solirubrobacterales bacterium]
MRSEACYEWRESLGAYALGQLPREERAGLEAHLDGCPDCRAELELLAPVARLLPKADPERLGAAPAPPAALSDRVIAAIAADRRATRRRKLRLGLAFSGATAAIAAAVLAIFVLPVGDSGPPATRVSFESLPPKMKVGAKLEPREFGTEIHIYVKGAPAGALCRVFVVAEDGSRLSAGSFRYRWSDDYPTLTTALKLSRTEAIGLRVGNRTFLAPVRASST